MINHSRKYGFLVFLTFLQEIFIVFVDIFWFRAIFLFLQVFFVSLAIDKLINFFFRHLLLQPIELSGRDLVAMCNGFGLTLSASELIVGDQDE